MTSVQDNTAADVCLAYNRPINIEVMEKVKKFAFIQELGFNGQLGFAKDTFHGLQDFNTQMATYSLTHPILRNAWSLISQLVPINGMVAKNLYISPTLGKVGNAFMKLIGFDQVFAVSPDELRTNPVAAAQKAGQ